jgi:glycosyltransferase involved in cell wall biosynthesis
MATRQIATAMPADAVAEWPSIAAVVPTRNRPQLLARAVAAVLAQDYPGELNVVVVVDQRDADTVVPDFDDPRVSVVDNDRTAGLSGARNTGILSAAAAWIAFCDDDDVWTPDKLTAQMAALRSAPDALMATTAIEVDFDGARNVRLAGADQVTYSQLLPSRMSMMHSSTFLIRREALLGEIGLVDEHVPGSQNEDWDLLLRAARLRPIVNVDRPLVIVQWTARSYFNRDWETKISSLEWMLAQHPDIAANRVGASRVYGQIGFAYAASGARRVGSRWALRSIRRSWREPRGYLALATAAGVSGEFILRVLHRRGHGI